MHRSKLACELFRPMAAASLRRHAFGCANAALSNVHIGDALGDLLQLARRQRLRLSGNLVQFFKTLAMAEGLLLKIHPESSFADYLRPMAGKLVLQGFVGRPGGDHLRDSAPDLAELVSDLPRRLDRLLGEIERGNLRIWTRIEDLDALLKRVEQVAARTNATILVAACIIGLAMVIPYYHPSRMGRVGRHSVLACCYGCRRWLH
jgi:ubiquinone biosynthesis protein